MTNRVRMECLTGIWKTRSGMSFRITQLGNTRYPLYAPAMITFSVKGLSDTSMSIYEDPFSENIGIQGILGDRLYPVLPRRPLHGGVLVIFPVSVVCSHDWHGKHIVFSGRLEVEVVDVITNGRS